MRWEVRKLEGRYGKVWRVGLRHGRRRRSDERLRRRGKARSRVLGQKGELASGGSDVRAMIISITVPISAGIRDRRLGITSAVIMVFRPVIRFLLNGPYIPWTLPHPCTFQRQSPSRLLGGTGPSTNLVWHRLFEG